MTAVGTSEQEASVGRLSTLDRFLPVWIGLAMAVGLLAGRSVPGLGPALDAVQVDGISLPIALGLLVMMYPVLAKVRYDRLDTVTSDRRLLVSSLVLNWVVGPALMFALAWLLLPDLPEYRTGLIIVGLARCIAMVIIWNDLARGDREAAAVLVALNSVFQVIAFAGLGWLYLVALPGWLGLDTAGLDVSSWDIARSVLLFLGVPLLAGYLTRRFGERAKGRVWYEEWFLPMVGPFALYGLLFTIVILFALQGDQITSQPLDVARIALPLLAYFAIMWTGSFALGKGLGLSYERSTTLAFTAAGNNFELAIAVAIATFGITSGEALAGVVGPLIEVPVLVALVYVSLAARRWFRSTATQSISPSNHLTVEGIVMTTPTRRGLPGLGELEIEHGLRAISHDLTKKFTGRLSPETVDRFVRASFTLMDRRAKVRVHLVALTRRFAWDRLTALEKVQNAVATGVPEVLFVCVHNAGRSQMAAALLAHHGQDRVVVRSAGSTPADEINPVVEETLHEIGVPLTDAYPKPLTDEVVRASDVVITMGCGDACPIYPGKRYLDWELDDPAGRPVDGVRAIRDDIDRRVRELLAELVPVS